MSDLRPGPIGGTSSAAAAAVTPSSVRMKSSGTVVRATDAGSNLRMYFQNTIAAEGSGIIVTSTAAAGTYFTVSTAGWYYVSLGLPTSNGSTGIKVSAILNNSFTANDEDLPLGYSANTVQDHLNGQVYCNASDKIWALTNGILSAYPEVSRFTIRGPL